MATRIAILHSIFVEIWHELMLAIGDRVNAASQNGASCSTARAAALTGGMGALAETEQNAAGPPIGWTTQAPGDKGASQRG